MAMLASDVNNREFVGAMDPDAVMYAEFHIKPILQPYESEKAGREIWKDVTYCRYGPSGNTLLQNDVPATDYHKNRFHRQWAMFQNAHGGDARLVGTPVTQWPILSPADAENLKSAKFFTVENIAGASDQQLQTLGMGVAGMSPYVLRAKAQAFIGVAQNTALPQAQAAEIEKLKLEAEQRELAHKEEMAELRAMIQGKTQATPKPEKPKKEKRKMSPEHLAAMAAGRAKAKEAKAKAE